MKTNKAFTLIEILISVSIISLLSTVVMYSTSEAKLKGEDAHMKVESDQVAKAIQLYKDDNNGKVPYPVEASFSQYKGQMINENDPDENKKEAYRKSMQILVDEGYLSDLPKSPDGSSYSYLVTEEQEDAVFAAALNFSSSGSNKNSCEVIGASAEVVNNCSIRGSTCTQEELNNENKICVNTPVSSILTMSESFCPIYNQEGDLTSSVCSCEDGKLTSNGCYYSSCDDYGRLIGWVSTGSGTRCRRMVVNSGSVICDYQSGNDVVCSGTSNSDYCSCI